MDTDLCLKINFDIDMSEIEKTFKNIQKQLKIISSAFDELNHSIDEIKSNLKNIGINKITDAVTIAISVFSVFIALIDAGIISINLLSAALIATGIGVFVILIGALIGAFISSSSATNDQTTAMDKLTETIDEQTESMQKLKEEQAEAIQNSVSQADYYSKLWDELQEINNAESINNEQRQRAAEIVSILNDQLETNISLTSDGRIANMEEIDSINKLIKAKRALMTLEALEPGYKEAIIAAGTAQATMQEILTQKIQKQMEIDAIMHDDSLGYGIKQARVAILKNEIEDLDALYEEAEGSYNEHLTTMNQYEELSGLAMNENYDLMDKRLEEMNSGLITTASGTTGQLTTQFNDFISEMKIANKEGSEFTENQMSLLKENLLRSTEELLASMENQGTLSTEERNQIAQKALEQIIAAGGYSIEELNDIFQRLGITTAEGAALVTTILQEQGEKTVDTSETSGLNAADGFNNSFVNETINSLFTIARAAQQNIDTTKKIYGENSPSKVFADIAKNVVAGFNQGVDDAQSSSTGVLGGWGDIIKNWFGNLKLPGIGVDVSYTAAPTSIMSSVMKFLNLPGFPSIKFSKYASGGLVDPGQLFLAREAGPELVGRIGAHTAVMARS